MLYIVGTVQNKAIQLHSQHAESKCKILQGSPTCTSAME